MTNNHQQTDYPERPLFNRPLSSISQELIIEGEENPELSPDFEAIQGVMDQEDELLVQEEETTKEDESDNDDTEQEINPDAVVVDDETEEFRRSEEVENMAGPERTLPEIINLLGRNLALLGQVTTNDGYRVQARRLGRILDDAGNLRQEIANELLTQLRMMLREDLRIEGVQDLLVQVETLLAIVQQQGTEEDEEEVATPMFPRLNTKVLALGAIAAIIFFTLLLWPNGEKTQPLTLISSGQEIAVPTLLPTALPSPSLAGIASAPTTATSNCPEAWPRDADLKYNDVQFSSWQQLNETTPARPLWPSTYLNNAGAYRWDVVTGSAKLYPQLDAGTNMSWDQGVIPPWSIDTDSAADYDPQKSFLAGWFAPLGSVGQVCTIDPNSGLPTTSCASATLTDRGPDDLGGTKFVISPALATALGWQGEQLQWTPSCRLTAPPP